MIKKVTANASRPEKAERAEKAGKAAVASDCPNKCPIKEALRFLSGAWTLEIYWNLSEAPIRFGELRRKLTGVSSKVLTHRLRDLEDLGVVHREVKETFPPQVEYSLTELGCKFLPILDSIADVGKSLLRKSKREQAALKATSKH